MKSLMKFTLAVAGVSANVSDGPYPPNPGPPMPNPPTWDTDTVRVFKPTDDQNQNQILIDAVYRLQGGQSQDGTIPNMWTEDRFALLFTPGYHNVTVPVGFYTQVMGLGRLAGMTRIKSIYSEAASENSNPGALRNYWRGAENLWTQPPSGTMMWATSQGSPLRRVVVQGSLDLFEISSADHGQPLKAMGSYMADSYVSGEIQTGSQRQSVSRNVHAAKTTLNSTNINSVQVGVEGSESSHCGDSDFEFPNYEQKFTYDVAEKPYIAQDFLNSTKFNLIVPQLESSLRGQSFHSNERVIPFEQVYVANNKTDNATTINQALAHGYSIVLQPGKYILEEPLFVTVKDTVILGLGLATLVPQTGKSAIAVNNVDGVRVAGVLLQAGKMTSINLMQVGIPDSNGNMYMGDSTNPTILQDVYARVGGDNNPNNTVSESAHVMLTVNSGNVIMDHVWLWRADLGAYGPVVNMTNPVHIGLEVYGDNVEAYGLFVDNALTNNTNWYGNGGKVYFLQSQLAFDATGTFNNQTFVGYNVNATVRSHKAYGVGVASAFTDGLVEYKNGFSAPDAPGVQFTNVFTAFVAGDPAHADTIRNVINNQGGPVGHNPILGQVQATYVCYYSDGKAKLASTQKEAEPFLQ